MQSVIRLAILPILLCSSTLAQHWPQFRGPAASGLPSQPTTLPTEFNIESTQNIAWRTPIPGLAHASPIIWSNTVYLLTVVSGEKAELKVGLYGDIAAANDNGPQTWRLLALDKQTGHILWDKVAHAARPRVKRHTKATHANSTPATDGTHIAAIIGSEGLFCFDSRGELLWKKDLGPMDSGFFMSKSAQWGFASSPVIHDGKIIVQCDVQTNSFIAAFDVKNGSELWRTERTDVPTWSTPTIVKIGSGDSAQTNILVNGWHHTGAYDLQTGREIWKHDGGGDIPTPTPIIGVFGTEQFAYFTSAHGRFRPMMAIRLTTPDGKPNPGTRGDITAPTLGETNAAIAWIHPRQGAYMQTPILVGHTLYSCTDNGILTAFSARTGQIHYSERLVPGGQGFTTSPVSDGKNIFFASETGNIFVVPAAEKFSKSGPFPLNETVMATPAISANGLYMRTRDHLVCIRER
jgi:outer membrane protein assembly factor BamB